MKAEYTPEDLKGAIRNPFFDKLNRKVEVAVRHETYSIYEEIAKETGYTPERVMRRCIETFAKTLQAHE